MSTTLEKSFSLHPSILYSIINEQAGDPVKSLTELVMNSLDAGATEVELHLSATNFSVKDNGVGFKNADDIDNFFGTFGTPHQQGDATYGKFRIGRGQNFAIASSTWRSGNFGMTVDLAGKSKTDTMGYTREEFDSFYEGCLIKGEFYKPLNVHEGIQSIALFNNQVDDFLEKYDSANSSFTTLIHQDDFMSRLVRAIGLVKSNVYINGFLITNKQVMKLIHESDLAHFYLGKSLKTFNVHFNKGIYISHERSSAPLIIDFKISPNLNLARNQVNSECPTYTGALREASILGFNAYLNKEKWASKLYEDIQIELNECQYGGDEIPDQYLSPTSLISLITNDNIEAFLNRHTVKFYKDGQFSSLPLLEAVKQIQANPEEYVLNNTSQIYCINSSSQQTLRNSLTASEFKNTMVFDEYGLLGHTQNCLGLNYLLDKHFPKYSFKVDSLATHEIFQSMEDLDEYKISKKVKKKSELEKVEAKNIQGNFSEVERYFVDGGFITLPEKADYIIEQTGEILSGYASHLAKLFTAHFKSDSIAIPENWLLSKPVDSIVVMPCKAHSVLSGEYDGNYYIFIHEYALKNNEWSTYILSALQNDLGITSEIIEMFQMKNTSQSCIDVLNTLTYEYDDVHHKIHNSLDGFLERHSLFNIIEEAQNQIEFLNERKTKMPITKRKDMKRMLSLINSIGLETPELIAMLKPELELMEQIYLDA